MTTVVQTAAEAPWHSRAAADVAAELGVDCDEGLDAGEVERRLRQVDARDVEPARVRLLLDRVVVVGEAVDAGDGVPERQQPFDDMRSDEAGRTGNDAACHVPGSVTVLAAIFLISSRVTGLIVAFS